MVHVVGELAVTGDLLMFFSDLHSGSEHHLDNFGLDRVKRTSFHLFWVQESHSIELLTWEKRIITLSYTAISGVRRFSGK